MRVNAKLTDVNHEEVQVSLCVVNKILGSAKINGHPRREMMKKDVMQHVWDDLKVKRKADKVSDNSSLSLVIVDGACAINVSSIGRRRGCLLHERGFDRRAELAVLATALFHLTPGFKIR